MEVNVWKVHYSINRWNLLRGPFCFTRILYAIADALDVKPGDILNFADYPEQIMKHK